jgi:hypothetical protein
LPDRLEEEFLSTADVLLTEETTSAEEVLLTEEDLILAFHDTEEYDQMGLSFPVDHDRTCHSFEIEFQDETCDQFFTTRFFDSCTGCRGFFVSGARRGSAEDAVGEEACLYFLGAEQLYVTRLPGGAMGLGGRGLCGAKSDFAMRRSRSVKGGNKMIIRRYEQGHAEAAVKWNCIPRSFGALRKSLFAGCGRKPNPPAWIGFESES